MPLWPRCMPMAVRGQSGCKASPPRLGLRTIGLLICPAELAASVASCPRRRARTAGISTLDRKTPNPPRSRQLGGYVSCQGPEQQGHCTSAGAMAKDLFDFARHASHRHVFRQQHLKAAASIVRAVRPVSAGDRVSMSDHPASRGPLPARLDTTARVRGQRRRSGQNASFPAGVLARGNGQFQGATSGDLVG
jgi:hypothetical protein